MKELKEAEFWLESARNLIESGVPNREKYTVVIAQCIHSIIRANDALTLRFLHKKALRHDDAEKLFLELIKLNKISPKYADLRGKVLIPAIQTKSKADYKGLEAGKDEAEKWIRLSERFLKAATESLTQ